MAIEWNRVTWYSQIVAVILGIAVFCLGYWSGLQKGRQDAATQTPVAAVPAQEGEPVTGDVTYACDGGKTIHAIYHADDVQLLLSDGRNLKVPHAISGSGARYANDDETFVFWSKGNTAFITEGAGGAQTYADCNQAPLPQ